MKAATDPCITYLTQIQIEAGARKLLAAECERVGIKKPLIVTDAGVRAAGVLQQVLDALPAGCAARSTTARRRTRTRRRCARRWRCSSEHGCDGLIAVGGGSSHRLRQGRGHRRHATPGR